MAARKDPSLKLYYFIDIDTHSRQIMAWDIETGDKVDVHPKNGCHRLFMSKGQYNKLVSKLEDAQSL